jgi:hypothetical protein
MLSSVLRSEEAVEVNVEVMRAFVRLRAVPAILDHFHKRMDALEERYDTKFKDVFDAIRALMESPESGPSSGPDPQPIGFRPHLDLGNLHDGALGMRPEEAVRGI